MKQRSHQVSVLVVLALLGSAALGAGGCLPGPRPQNTLPTTEPAVIEDNSLGPGDVFEVRVYGEKELSNTYRVSPDGTIDFPLVGTVSVKGLTPPDVAGKIAAKLRDGYLKNPQVTVFIKEVNSKKIFVFGQVSKPGTFNYEQNMSVIQAITLAGGFTPLANKNETTVTRHQAGKKHKLRVKVEEIAEGSERNFVLKPGDIVFVPERFF